jgi:hypothetical protein
MTAPTSLRSCPPEGARNGLGRPGARCVSNLWNLKIWHSS